MASRQFKLSPKPVHAIASIDSASTSLKPPRQIAWAERMHTNAPEKETLILAERRFAWMTLAIYACLTVGLWLARVVFPNVIGPSMDYDYVVSASVIAAVAFGGMYAAAMALRPAPPDESVTAGGP
ncbi:MAG TPA: hypothetical protein VI999_05285 [Thermoplasmata archaeon]|nr:hypothetical protein [Thermoplasmata archaeon]